MGVNGGDLQVYRCRRDPGKLSDNYCYTYLTKDQHAPSNLLVHKTIQWDLPICSPWTFRENHSPNIIYTVNRRNQPTAMDLYFLDWVRTRYKTEPETHTKSAPAVL